MIKIYLDECGFTGEDLFNSEQPIFTLASIDLSEELCHELKDKYFGSVQAYELKHSNLAKRPKQQEMVINLIKGLGSNYPKSIKFSVAHKRYVLVTKIVDILIETLAYEDGINLYKDGANLAYSNILFYVVRSLVSEEFFNNMIFSFQEMIRARTMASYDRFFKPLFETEFPEILDEFLSLLKAFHIRYGYRFLETLPEKALDIAFSDALTLMNEWKTSIPEAENIVLIHDRSSNMATEKDFWDKLVSPTAPSKLVGFDRRKMSYPLRIERTEFGNSKDLMGLQIADILAGAITRYFKWIINGKSENDKYGKELSVNMPESFGGHMIWPSPEVTPNQLGTTGSDADDPIEYVNKIRKELYH